MMTQVLMTVTAVTRGLGGMVILKTDDQANISPGYEVEAWEKSIDKQGPK